jgi:ribosomal protein L11 methylase PrmA
MRDDLKSRLLSGGILIISGIPHTRRDEAVRGLNAAGFKLHNELREGDWVALEFRLN